MALLLQGLIKGLGSWKKPLSRSSLPACTPLLNSMTRALSLYRPWKNHCSSGDRSLRGAEQRCIHISPTFESPDHRTPTLTLKTQSRRKNLQIYSNMTAPIQTIITEQSEITCNTDSQGRRTNADPSAGTGLQLPSHPLTFPANPLPSPRLRQAPFKFQGVPEATPFAPHSPPFTFEGGLTYPTPVLSSGFSPISTPTRSSSTIPVSDLVHQLEGLGHEDDEQPAGPLHPAPPVIDTRAERRRIRREHEYKQMAARHARTEAERVAKEVKRQAIRDDNGAKRQAESQEQRDHERTPAPLFLSVSPATVALPQTTFTTTLAHRPPSGASQGLLLIGIPPLPPPVRPVTRPPLQPSARDSTVRPLQPRHSRNQPTPKGILRKPTAGTTFILPKPPRSVRFNECIDMREDGGDTRDVVVVDPL